MANQWQKAKPENHPAAINRIRTIWVPIVQETMRERVSKIGTGLGQKHALDVGRNSGRENAVEFRPHLLKQGGYSSILLCLGCVIKVCDVMPIRLQNVPQRAFQ